MKSLKPYIIFPIHFVLQMTNLGLWGLLIFGFGIVRFILPIPFVSKALLRLMHWFYFTFSVISVGLIKLFNNIKIEIKMDEALSKDKWYLIIANHISYLDIILLIRFCAMHTSPPKFFLKKELIWLPFVGIAAWALDMPFMRRYTQEFVAKNPHLKGKDIETTKKSCEKFIDSPTSVINFVEGTRFTPIKAQQRNSPFSHLLRPKAGGIAFTLAAMGEQFSSLLDITLAYPSNSGHPMTDMLCGDMTHIVIDVKVLPVSEEIIGNYFENEKFRNGFQIWLNELWTNKNQRMKAWMGD
ncbi:acyltransferase [Glaciecola sp. MH2013]|uniref:acyltransferase n=1 Tax=Glaciecola sp. MH2013 TaxID=2785524 RepID=UPI00189CEC67|nr:acyltransferase [Glaciecola sp. MH2013]MBF7074984.1 acyltransferase [Glaciecola sp. MH2013]